MFRPHTTLQATGVPLSVDPAPRSSVPFSGPSLQLGPQFSPETYSMADSSDDGSGPLESSRSVVPQVSFIMMLGFITQCFPEAQGSKEGLVALNHLGRKTFRERQVGSGSPVLSLWISLLTRLPRPFFKPMSPLGLPWPVIPRPRPGRYIQ